MSEPLKRVSEAPEVPPQHRMPGIHFSGVVLDRLDFSDLAPGEPAPESLQFFFGVRRKIFDDPTIIEVTVLVRILPPDDITCRFRFEASITGRFEKLDGPGVLPLTEFAKANGPALVMPYARELVTNVTARSRHGTIIFPPVNVVKLVADEQRATSGAGAHRRERDRS